MLDQIWTSLTDFLIVSISPFWGYFGTGILIIVAATVASYYFSVLRSLAGAIVLGVVTFLYAFRKGEKSAEQRQELRDQHQKQNHQNPWEW